MTRLSKSLLLCLCIMNTFAPTQLEAKQIEFLPNENIIDCNTSMKDRYSILDIEQKRIEQERKEKESKKYIEINCELSFYTTLNCENGYGAVDAQGNSLKFGTIAIPREINLGTKFSFDYFGDMIFTGTDRGSKNHIRITENGIYRIDVCIERPNGYSDYQYWEYVNNMGKIKTKGKMYL